MKWAEKLCMGWHSWKRHGKRNYNTAISASIMGNMVVMPWIMTTMPSWPCLSHYHGMMMAWLPCLTNPGCNSAEVTDRILRLRIWSSIYFEHFSKTCLIYFLEFFPFFSNSDSTWRSQQLKKLQNPTFQNCLSRPPPNFSTFTIIAKGEKKTWKTKIHHWQNSEHYTFLLGTYDLFRNQRALKWLRHALGQKYQPTSLFRISPYFWLLLVNAFFLSDNGLLS